MNPITIAQLDNNEPNVAELEAEVNRLGLDVTGTGKNGKVVKADLAAAVRARLEQPPAEPPADPAAPEDAGAAPEAIEPPAAPPDPGLTAPQPDPALAATPEPSTIIDVPRRANRHRGPKVAEQDIYDNGGPIGARRLVARKGQRIPAWYRG